MQLFLLNFRSSKGLYYNQTSFPSSSTLICLQWSTKWAAQVASLHCIFQVPLLAISRLHLTSEKCVTKSRTTKGRTMTRRQNSRRHKKANLKSQNSNSSSHQNKKKKKNAQRNTERNEIKLKCQNDNGIGNGMPWKRRKIQKERVSGKVWAGTKPMRNQSARMAAGRSKNHLLRPQSPFTSHWKIFR